MIDRLIESFSFVHSVSRNIATVFEICVLNLMVGNVHELACLMEYLMSALLRYQDSAEIVFDLKAH